MAFVYDLFILGALSMGYWAAATAIMAAMAPGETAQDYQPMQQGQAFNIGWILAIVLFYWFFFRRAGQTVGMRAWRLRIVSRDGERLSHRQIFIRIAVAPFALGFAGVGYLWCLTNRDRLAWQDLASNSRVIAERKK